MNLHLKCSNWIQGEKWVFHWNLSVWLEIANADKRILSIKRWQFIEFTISICKRNAKKLSKTWQFGRFAGKWEREQESEREREMCVEIGRRKDNFACQSFFFVCVCLDWTEHFKRTETIYSVALFAFVVFVFVDCLNKTVFLFIF